MTQTDRQQGRTVRTLRSSTVVLGSMGALAAALSGCASEPDKRCVDKDSYDAVRGYKTLSASQCATGTAVQRAGAAEKPASSAAQASTAVHASTATHAGASTTARTAARSAEPRWYYDGETDGRRAHDGTFDRNLAVERGGFGCDDDDSDSSGTSGG